METRKGVREEGSRGGRTGRSRSKEGGRTSETGGKVEQEVGDEGSEGDRKQ